MRKTLPTGNMGWIQKGQEFAGVCFLVLGICLCLESILNISIPWKFRLLTAVGLGFYVELLGMGRKWFAAGMVLLMVLFVQFATQNQEILQIGNRELSNRVLELINDYHRTDFLYWYLKDAKDYAWLSLLCVCLLVGLLEGFLLLASRKKVLRMPMLLICPVFVIAAGLTVGRTASVSGVIMVLSGIFVLLLDIRQGGAWLLMAGTALCMVVAVFGTREGILWNQVQILHNGWIKNQLAFENRMLEAISEFSQSSPFSNGEKKQYDMDNDVPAFTGKKVLEITLNNPVTQPVYIRGFIGGDYKDGSWTKVSRQEFSDWAQQQGGTEQEYAKIIQSFSYEFLEDQTRLFLTEIGKKTEISLELEEKMRGYTLMPYYTKVPEQMAIKADGAIPPRKDQSFQWDSYVGISEQSVELATAVVPETFLEDEDSRKRYQIWRSYENYVQKVYTRFPQEDLQELKEWAKERMRKEEKKYKKQMRIMNDKLSFVEQNGMIYDEQWQALTEEEQQLFQESDTQRLIKNIQQILWEENIYSFDLKKVPEGRDVTEYFLLEQHKGYCVHFASAATLLFRMNDVPARYVSGYLVVPSDFKKNEDGTFTAVITDERAHAWVEVFDQNIGFHPVEATPSSYTELLTEMQKGERLEHAVARLEQQESSKLQNAQKQETQNNQKKETKEKPEQKKQKENTKQEQKNGSKPDTEQNNRSNLLFAVLCFVGVLAAVWSGYFLLEYRRKSVRKKRWERFSQEDHTKAVLEIRKELQILLHLMGYGNRSEMEAEEYQEMLAEELPEIDWEQAFAILQKALFSRDGIALEEYQEILTLYGILEQRLAQKGGIRGWYLKYIKMYP